MRREVFNSPRFIRDARRWAKKHPHGQVSLLATLAALEADAFQPSLGTHKLKGRLSAYHACSAGYNIRIVFEFFATYGSVAIRLIELGTHDDVYN